MVIKSSYSSQSRAEHLIGAGRVVLAVFSLLAIWLHPSEPSKYANLACSLLAGYVVYAILVAFLVWKSPKPLGRLPLITHIFDLIVFSVLVYLTESATSPFFVYFVFAILCATVRWRWRGTLCTGVAALVSFIGLGTYAAWVLKDPDFELNRFIIRSVYLGVIATLLGYLGIYQERRRREISMLAEWPHAVLLELRGLVRATLEHAGSILHSSRAVMAWDEQEEPWLHLASWSPGEFHLTRESPTTFHPLVAEPLSGSDFFCLNLPVAVPTVLHMSSTGFQRWEGAPLHPDLQARFAIETVLCLKLRGERLQGRLFFLDKRSLTSDDLLLGRIVAREVVARLDLFYLIQQFEQMAATESRLHVARDLHDGLLQSLAVMTMKLDDLSHLLDEAPRKAKERLLEIDHLLRKEQEGLRSFIRKLKAASRGMPQQEVSLATRLEDLVKQVKKEWDLHVNLTQTSPDLHLSEALAEEVHYLLREALHNAWRHGGASSVGVELRMENHQLRITVADNGGGFSFRGHYDHATLMERELGPVTLKGRIASLGGALAIESSEAGARVDITLPIPGPGA